MPVTYLPSTKFRTDLDRRVDAYFDRTGLPRRDAPAMYAKTALLFAWLGGSYAGFLFGAQSGWAVAAAAISIGLAMAAIGFNVQHDGGHGAYSDRRWVNRAMALSLDLLGGSSYFWGFKHNIAHHSYPNISGSDDDIYVGPLARLSPHDRWFPYHRLQHLYIWLLYGLLALKWQVLDDFRFIAAPGIADTHVPAPRGWDRAFFWLGKVAFFAAAFGVPLLFHPWGLVLEAYAISGVTVGLVLGTVFQLAHCVEDARYGLPDGRRCIGSEWAAYQVESAVDFGRDSPAVTWFVGGLNFQIEHHLYPKICHVHYPALSPIVEAVCREHGVRFQVHGTTRAAIASHYRWLRTLGRRPAPAALPA